MKGMFYVIIAIFLLVIQLSEGYFPRNEWNSLYDLYNSTDGWNWIWQDYYGALEWNFSNVSVNPCSPIWQGLDCTYNNITNEYSIIGISLSFYNLVGMIPDSLNEFTNLGTLDLSENSLHGTIPESMYNLSYLTTLKLNNNMLNGTLSESFYRLRSLELIDIDQNELAGSLPESMYSIPTIQKIALSFNNFKGSISSSIGNLSYLGYLDFSYNIFTFSLPNSFYKLTRLKYIYLDHNELTGTISSNISLFKKLYGINLGNNRFFGSVPADWICGSFNYVDVANNLLTGTLPNCSATMVDYTVLQGNSFHGTVPSGYWLPSSGLQLINLGLNFLDGSIVFTNSILTGFVLNQNQFTGIIPIAPEGTYIYSIHNNYFFSELSEGVWDSLYYALLDISENYLFGPFHQVNLSNSISTMNISMNLFDSYFYFPIPSKGNTLLKNLALSKNQFTGTLPNNWTVYSVLETLDVSDNQFTGSLPEVLPQSIQVFSASSNCFHGSFPVQLCELTHLETLILNGLSSSKQCQNRLFPDTIVKTFETKYGMSDGIPTCFLTLPLLNSLYLSGNELTGSLPSYSITAPLINLDLSHNQFRGIIPPSFQSRSWKQLDLSYNLIDGTLSSSIYSFSGSQSSLRLQANRLSGSVPSPLIDAQNINILDGNLFSCNFDSSKLPQNDPTVDNYSCGSDSANAAIYLWVALIVVGVITLLIGYYSMKHNTKWFLEDLISFSLNRYRIYEEYVRYQVTKEGESNNVVSKVNDYSNLLLLKLYNQKIRKLSFMITLFSVLLLLPCFSILSNYYSIYEQRYSWILSALYLEGRISAMILSLILFLFLFYFLVFCYQIWSKGIASAQIKGDEGREIENNHLPTIEESITREERTLRRMIYALGGFLNLVVMLSVDLLYVYIALNYNTTVITLSLIMMALGKILWNSFFIWRGLAWCRKMILQPYDTSPSKKVFEKFRRFSKEDIAFVSFTLGLNNLIYPAMALLILSTNCYHNAFFQASDDVYSYSFNTTWTTAFDSSTYSTYSSVYTPPFTYSYKCSSDIYAYYCPLFIFIFIFEGLLMPAVQLVWMHRYAKKKFNDNNEKKAVELKKIESKGSEIEDEKISESTTTTSSSSSIAVFVDQIRILMNGIMFFSDANDVTSHSILFHKHRYVVRFHSYLLVLLIYGIVFPPLALIGFISIVVRTLFEEVIFGHLLELSRRQRFIHHEIEKKLNKDCQGLLDSMEYFLLICIPIPLLIYSFLIFDTFGRNTEIVIGLLPAMILFSLYIIVVILLSFYRRKLKQEKSNNNDHKQKVEEGFTSTDNPIHNGILV